MSAEPPTERDPTRDKLLAMAYVDGELADEQRSAFEQRLRDEPALAREVAELRRLEIAARLSMPHDPLDAEWARLRTDRVHAWLRRGALAALCAALLVVLALAATGQAPSCEPRWIACAALAALGATCGLAALLRARLRTRAVDPYVHVER